MRLPKSLHIFPPAAPSRSAPVSAAASLCLRGDNLPPRFSPGRIDSNGEDDEIIYRRGPPCDGRPDTAGCGAGNASSARWRRNDFGWRVIAHGGGGLAGLPET